MKSSYIAAFLAQAACAFASLHNVGACVTNRKYDVRGGTGWSVSYNYGLTYEIDTGVTQCACDFYRRRNTGNQWWDKCPDCSFDGTYSHSKDWHIGGDELNYYCEKLCHAQGSEANPSNCKKPPCK